MAEGGVSTQRKRFTNPQAKSKKKLKEDFSSKSEKRPRKTLKYALIAVSLLTVAVFFIYLWKSNTVSLSPALKKGSPQSKKAMKRDDDPKNKAKKLRDLMNKHDRIISDVLSKGNKLLENGKIEESIREFTFLSSKYPKSPLARYIKAQSLDKKAHKVKSNELLLEAAKIFHEVADIEGCPSELVKLTLQRQAAVLVFLGKYVSAVKSLERLVGRFPDDPEVHKSLGVQYLMAGKTESALKPFKRVLELNANDGNAKSHVGFILKALNRIEESIPYFEEGVHSGHDGADDAKFFYHLGDAYIRLGRPREARRVYEEGAKKGLFLSAQQRSLYNADAPLKAQPWWTHREARQVKHFATLEKKWKVIRDEALSLLNVRGDGGFQDESEKLQDTGDWKQLTLFHQGQRDRSGCMRAPQTCEIISGMNEATGCKRGQIKFSVMYPGTHVWPHTGPTNCRLRAHLGLVVPKNVFIRAGDEIRSWQEGKVLVFDDSFEHEVWHNGTSFRLILIIDFWHPDLTNSQKRHLSPI